jgi:hypothetical protein
MACTSDGGTGVKRLAAADCCHIIWLQLLLMVDDAWEVLACLLVLIVLAWL